MPPTKRARAKALRHHDDGCGERQTQSEIFPTRIAAPDGLAKIAKNRAFFISWKPPDADENRNPRAEQEHRR